MAEIIVITCASLVKHNPFKIETGFKDTMYFAGVIAGIKAFAAASSSKDKVKRLSWKR